MFSRAKFAARFVLLVAGLVLAVVGPSSADPNNVWQDSGANIYYNQGNVGIGTTSPGVKLEVAGQIKFGGSSAGDATAFWATDEFGNLITNGGTDAVAYIKTPAGGGQIEFRSNNEATKIATFTSSGKVGIGTNKPTATLQVVGDLMVTGTKSFVQDDPIDPAKQIVYVSLEGPEAGTYFRGTAQLNNGEAVIDLPEHFSMVTNEDGLTVQLTALGGYLQLYVMTKTTKQLVIREAQGKSGQFDYLVQGVRKGYEQHQVIQAKP